MNLVVFSDDWGRHPSSSQHLIRYLMQGPQPPDRTLWINTIGTRTPRLDTVTMRRGISKMVKWASLRKKYPTCDSPDAISPEIYNPLMLPWFRQPAFRKINHYLLKKSLARTLRNITGEIVAVTTLPIVADIVGENFPGSPISRWVYYCVDDWSQWPGSDGIAMNRMEKKLIAEADIIIAAGVSLQQRIQSLGRESTLLTHGVELAHWRPSAVPPAEFRTDYKISQQNSTIQTKISEILDNFPPPYFTFWGLIDERLDSTFVRQLASDLNEGTILIVGPSVSASITAPMAHPRVHFPGVFAYEELPALGGISDVLIMPYRDIPVTQQMQPLKMTEYLATGRPVVARGLPACLAWGDGMDIADDSERFSKFARLRSETGLTDAQKIARQRLSDESWEQKSRQFHEIITRNQ